MVHGGGQRQQHVSQCAWYCMVLPGMVLHGMVLRREQVLHSIAWYSSSRGSECPSVCTGCCMFIRVHGIVHCRKILHGIAAACYYNECYYKAWYCMVVSQQQGQQQLSQCAEYCMVLHGIGKRTSIAWYSIDIALV